MLEKIVSGGQTGVDRAALDAAIEQGLAHGGWCPRGRLAEDGSIPERYALLETDFSGYAVRTKRNVIDSDGTLVLNRGELEGGTLLTVDIAKRRSKPLFVADLDAAIDNQEILRWIAEHDIRTLNIAGPKESKRSGIYRMAHAVLCRLIAES